MERVEKYINKLKMIMRALIDSQLEDNNRIGRLHERALRLIMFPDSTNPCDLRSTIP